MQLILTGFTHDGGFRVFAFDRIGEDRVRTQCTVRADLALIRNYGISIQDLPLLCRALLDRGEQSLANPALTFGESDMMECADQRAAAKSLAASRRKPPVRPAASATANSGWANPVQNQRF